MKVAREKGLPELKHHLLPRTKGFQMLNQGAAGRGEFQKLLYKGLFQVT
jgi:hypothetical protein